MLGAAAMIPRAYLLVLQIDRILAAHNLLSAARAFNCISMLSRPGLPGRSW